MRFVHAFLYPLPSETRISLLFPLPLWERARVRGINQEAMNSFQDSLKIFKNVIIPKTHNAKASSFEICSPLTILAGLIHMFTTIQLNNQVVLQRTKINDIGTDRLLPPEFYARNLSRTELKPEPLFSISLIMS